MARFALAASLARLTRAPLLLSALLLVLTTPAASAPIARPAELTLSIGIPGLGLREPTYPYSYVSLPVATGTGPVFVDAVAQSISVGAGLAAFFGAFTAIQTASTAVSSVTMTKLSNLSGTFAIGGAGGVAGEPPCPLAGAGACVNQSGLGGAMGITGTVNIHIVPNVVVIPLAFGDFDAGLAGPPDTDPWTTDAAPWTIGTGAVRFTGVRGTFTSTDTGGVTGSTLRLVAPTYVLALGNRLPIFTEFEIAFTDGLGVPDFVFDTVPETGVAVLALAALVSVGALRRSTSR